MKSLALTPEEQVEERANRLRAKSDLWAIVLESMRLNRELAEIERKLRPEPTEWT